MTAPPRVFVEQCFRCSGCGKRHIMRVIADEAIARLLSGVIFLAPCRSCQSEQKLEAY